MHVGSMHSVIFAHYHRLVIYYFLILKGAPTLIMGNHQLKGTANKLKEPFAVLRKRKADEVTNSTDNGDTDSESKLKKTSGVQLQVVGVVKKKLMFAQYPKSIMR